MRSRRDERKDALNEFVSAADDYAEAGLVGARIRILLRRKGVRAVIAIESSKAGDDRTLGEKAIGLLAFQQLGARCDVVSRVADSDDTWTLRLRRGDTSADLVREKRRARSGPGTTVFISELDAEAARVLTQRKVVDYLRRRRGQAIAAGAYTIGTTIIDDLAELDEFERPPWTSGHLSGRVSFEPLRQSAGRRAVLRDDEIYPVFRDAVQSAEPVLTAAIERVREEVDAATADRVSDALRQVFGRVLKELADLENPMRTLLGHEPGEGATELALPSPGDGAGGGHGSEPETSLDELEPRPSSPGPPHAHIGGGSAAPGCRQRHLPSVAPDPAPGHRRSRFDADTGTVLYNEQHARVRRHLPTRTRRR